MMALIIGMALGFTDLTPEDIAGTLVHEFVVLLDSVEAEILSIPNYTSPDPITAMQTKQIQSEFAYLQAFDEVIRKQIL